MLSGGVGAPALDDVKARLRIGIIDSIDAIVDPQLYAFDPPRIDCARFDL
jgi:hypothetical protein